VNRSKAAILKTSPETVLEDYSSLLDMAGFREVLSPGNITALHATLDWHHFFPSVSTPPWQLDGVLKKLEEAGFQREKIFVCYNQVRGVSFQKGQVLNRHATVLQRHHIPFFFFEENTPCINYIPKTALRVLHRFFPNGIPVPERLLGSSLLHLSTMKTSLAGKISGCMMGALKCLAGGNIGKFATFLDEAVCDALTLSKEMHPGMFAVMDGVFAGEGANPRNLLPHEKNLILASADPVALDAIALYLMGFYPLDIPYIRMAHESGLGTGDISEIETSGADIKELRFQFTITETPGAARVRSIENLLSGGFLSPLSELVSTLYYDWYWYLAFSEERIKKAMKGGWGKVFEGYRR
jgi:uncharacterized protein (DUF362 family)